MAIDFAKAVFIKSVVELDALVPDMGAEIAFVGRSNAGKSSALNRITGIKQLARVSKQPGRTQAINLFKITENQRLADLPGYGYAKVPLALKKRWQALLGKYLETRASLKGLCIIMDIRHALSPLDWQLLEWAKACHLDTHILLSKADKLSRGNAINALHQVKKALKQSDCPATCQLFSALSGDGLPEARKRLGQWLTT